MPPAPGGRDHGAGGTIEEGGAKAAEPAFHGRYHGARRRRTVAEQEAATELVARLRALSPAELAAYVDELIASEEMPESLYVALARVRPKGTRPVPAQSGQSGFT